MIHYCLCRRYEISLANIQSLCPHDFPAILLIMRGIREKIFDGSDSMRLGYQCNTTLQGVCKYQDPQLPYIFVIERGWSLGYREGKGVILSERIFWVCRTFSYIS